MVGKSLVDKFTEEYEKNLGNNKSYGAAIRAFEKTNEDLGFDAYSSFSSYITVKNRRFKNRKR